MNGLVELAHNIAKYNLIGKIKLPMIKLVIIRTEKECQISKKIIEELGCEEVQSFAEMMGIGGCHCFRSHRVKNMEVFLIDSIYGEEALEDRQFVRRRKILQNLRANKEAYFLHLNEESMHISLLDTREEIMSLKRVGSMVGRDFHWKGDYLHFCRDMVKMWEIVNRFSIITSLQDIKMVKKQCSREQKRESQWLKLIKKQLDPLTYAFQLNYSSKSYLVNSFQGYYSPQTVSFPNKYSIHWQIMDVLEDHWKEEGEVLREATQKMPLSYIEEMLRMNDFNSIGGFLPESCFLKIFKPLLERFAETTIRCLQAAKYKIIQNVQMVYEYYYAKTNIKQLLIDLELSQIEAICDRFLQEVSNAINSQISYVYVPAEAFWQMRNIRSQLYSAEQQANIEIKYIGKIYVRKVYDSIRESVPRLLGQGLLRKISRYVYENSLHNLLSIIKQTPIEMALSVGELEEIENKEVRRKECDRLINFFSLKVNSTYLLKNLKSRFDERWRQMFDQEEDEEEQRPVERVDKKQKGFLNWMKRLFKKTERQGRQKRSNSTEKSMQVEVLEEARNQNYGQQKKNIVEPAITDKAWILIMHSNKKMKESRILLAACQGFSEKLRANIWYWISTRDSPNLCHPKLTAILENAQTEPQIAHQIEKDLSRTPPSQLFRKKYRKTLRRVLQAYSLVDGQIGYTQGMNFVASTIICTLIHYGIKDDYLAESSQHQNDADLEDRCLVIFRFAMEKCGFRQMMLIEKGHIAELCFKLDQKIEQLNPKVSDIIHESGFSCDVIFGPLLISGLSTWSSKMQIKQRIMDLILMRGVDMIYHVVAGIAVMSEQQLSRLRNEEVYDFLRNKALDVFFAKTGEKGLTELFLSF